MTVTTATIEPTTSVPTRTSRDLHLSPFVPLSAAHACAHCHEVGTTATGALGRTSLCAECPTSTTCTVGVSRPTRLPTACAASRGASPAAPATARSPGRWRHEHPAGRRAASGAVGTGHTGVDTASADWLGHLARAAGVQDVPRDRGARRARAPGGRGGRGRRGRRRAGHSPERLGSGWGRAPPPLKPRSRPAGPRARPRAPHRTAGPSPPAVAPLYVVRICQNSEYGPTKQHRSG